MNRFSVVLKSMTTVVLSFLFTVIAFAEDEPAADLSLYEGGGGEFYTQLWFWVTLGLVFMLLLVALLRGGKKKE